MLRQKQRQLRKRMKRKRRPTPMPPTTARKQRRERPAPTCALAIRRSFIRFLNRATRRSWPAAITICATMLSTAAIFLTSPALISRSMAKPTASPLRKRTTAAPSATMVRRSRSQMCRQRWKQSPPADSQMRKPAHRRRARQRRQDSLLFQKYVQATAAGADRLRRSVNAWRPSFRWFHNSRVGGEPKISLN